MNNWDKWIDPRVRQVKPADIQRYLLARGWRPISSPRRQLLFFEEPRGHQGKPVTQTVPASDGGSDYLDAVVRVITNLAALEDRFAGDVLSEILQQSAAEQPAVNGPGRPRGSETTKSR